MNRFTIDQLAQQHLPVYLRVHSSEGDIYTARVTLPDGARGVLCDEKGDHLMTRSLEAMRARVTDISKTQTELVHHLAYDEMIGLGESKPAVLPLHW